MNIATEDQSKKTFRRLRLRITIVCTAVIALVLGTSLCLLAASEYNARVDVVEEQLEAAFDDYSERQIAKGESTGPTEVRDDSVIIGEGATMVAKDLPIVIYKLDYEGRSIAPAEKSRARLSDEALAATTEKILDAPSGFTRLSDFGLMFYKGRLLGSDIAVITDAAGVNEYITSLARAFVSVFVLIVLLAAAGSWALSRWIVSPIRDMWKKQQRFIADASHELKTPVSVVMANADIVMGNSKDPEEVRTRAGIILDESEKMKRLIADMMYLLTDKALTAKREEIDLSRMCVRCALAFEAKAWERQNMIDYGEIDSGISVTTDPVGMERVVGILLDNACKYAYERTEIGISLNDNKKEIRLAVSNKGPKIAPEDIDHIFDRFFRTDSARTRTNETSYGLGLAMARDIVEANGGTARAISDDEETIFEVVLPRTSEDRDIKGKTRNLKHSCGNTIGKARKKITALVSKPKESKSDGTLSAGSIDHSKSDAVSDVANDQE